ncbi:MAG TPA: ATP-binding protein, partial [Methylomirabilota bacterium]|nr:ATP-binding protein [Methylomirabilota bacterium]
ALTAGSDNTPIGVRRDGAEFVLDVDFARVEAPGGPVALLVIRDATEWRRREDERAEQLRREQTARTEAEQAAQQSSLLAEASRMLVLSLDYATTLTGLARLSAGTLADWCAVDLVEDDGEVRRLAVAHAEPARDGQARQLQAASRSRADVPEAVGRVLSRGEAELFVDVDEHGRDDLARGQEQLRLLGALGARSAMVVPMLSGERVLGALTLVRAGGDAYAEADLAVARELASRAALAVDHGRRYQTAEDDRARFSGLVDGLDAIVWEADPQTLELTFVSQRAETLLGFPLRRWLRSTFWTSLIHPDDREAVLVQLRDCLATGRDCRLEYRVAGADGRFVWVTNLVHAARRADGTAERLQGLVLDATARRHELEDRERRLAAAEAARVAAEAATQRARFLAEASDLLASSLDHHATLDALVQLAIPRFADWCFVHLAEPVGGRRFHVAGIEPSGGGIGEALERLAPSLPLSSVLPAIDRVKERQPLLVPEMGTAWLEGLALLQTLAPKSLMVVPMLAQDRPIGTLAFIATKSDRRYGAADLALARELAQRAATAVDHARAYAEAESANRAKDQFLATLSHELRTPLTAMLGWVLMLQSGRLTGDEAASALASIERNTRVQAQLINDLLDISRIVAGKLQLDRRPVDLQAVVAHALESVRPAADAKRITIACETAGAWVAGDGVRLEQVVVNLLGNAVKFTPDGGHVQVAVTADEGWARLTVRDTGQGIEAAVLPHIFDSFRQADSSSTRRHGGLGLGLAIVRRLVAMHGGHVQAASAGRDRGATFTVTLPLLPDEARPVGTAAPGTPRAADDPALPKLERVRALVVDDHEDSRRFVQTVLSGCGAEVRVAASVDAALEILADTYIDVVVSDIGMPGSDGYDFIGRLRATEREHGGSLPVVALTAYASEEDRDRVLGAGFSAHVAKPVSPAALARVVAAVIDRPALR